MPRAAEASPPVATVGERAERVLTAFLALQAGNEAGPPSSRDAAVELLTASFALLRRFPQQTRADFVSVLPLTRLEQELLLHARLDHPGVAEALAKRLAEWATRSPVFIDEANVHAADFLTRLVPHLDRWELRQEALAAAHRLAEV